MHKPLSGSCKAAEVPLQAVLKSSPPTLPVPCPACHNSWKGAAASYLDVGGQLLAQLQSEEGAVLTEQLLTEVAVAREALEKADAAYNKALDKLEVRSSTVHSSLAILLRDVYACCAQPLANPLLNRQPPQLALNSREPDLPAHCTVACAAANVPF
jgi:hypothetical protein